MTPALRITQLVVEARDPKQGWSPIANGIDLHIEPGEVVALIGESGAGKTTVGLAALGYARPGTRIIDGSIAIGDCDLLSLPPAMLRTVRGQKVAYVAQSAAASLNPAIRIGRQIAEARHIHRLDRHEADTLKIVERLLGRMGLPAPRDIMQRYPHQLSGGQQQRAMIALAMACSPELLVLDEPTTALDVTSQIEVLCLLKETLRHQDRAALYISHNLAVVAQLADRIAVIKSGQIVEIEPAATILSDPQHSYTRQLLRAVKPQPRVRTAAAGSAHHARTPILTARHIHAGYASRRGLFKRLLGEPTLIDVSLEIADGEVVALVGESGSGKSTLAKVLSGLLSPTAGSVHDRSGPLAAAVGKRSLDQLRRFQLIVQSPDTSLNPGHKVEEVIGRPLSLYFSKNRAEQRSRVEELLKLVRLPASYADRYSFELSGGEKQRVSIARALAAEPEVLICDEILSSLDAIVSSEILELMKSLQRELKLSCLFISHDLSVVKSIADRVVVLYGGKVCESGTVDEVFTSPRHPYTMLLLSSIPKLRRDWIDEVLTLREVRVADADADAGPMPRDDTCVFRARCARAMVGVCDREPPPRCTSGQGHIAYCHWTKAPEGTTVAGHVGADHETRV